MGHIKLKKLSLRSFRSFKEKTTIEFPDTGLVLIRGHNLDTGGSSGSGKSSLNLAIAYAFGYCPYPATALVNWGAKDPMQVEVEFESDDGYVVLTRGQKLSLSINGVKLTGNVKSIEDRLQKIIGLDSNLLSLLTYRQQKKPGLFLSSTDAEKKEYLTTLLNLSAYEQAVEAAQDRIAQIEKSGKFTDLHEREVGIGRDIQLTQIARDSSIVTTEDIVVGDLKALENLIKSQEALAGQKMNDLGDVNTDLAKETLVALQDLDQQKQSLLQKLNTVRQSQRSFEYDNSPLEQLHRDLKEIDQRVQTCRANDQARRTLDQFRLNAISKHEVEFRYAIDIKAKHERAIIDTQKQIDDLLNEARPKCPTCNQDWLQPDVTKFREEIAFYQDKVDSSNKIIAGWPVLDKEREEIEKRRNTPNATLAALEELSKNTGQKLAEESEKMKSAQQLHLAASSLLESQLQNQLSNLELTIKERVEEIEKKFEPTLTAIHKDINQLSADITKARTELMFMTKAFGAQNAAMAAEKQNYIRYDTLVTQRQKDLVRVLEEMKALEAELAKEKDFVKLVGREGFLGAIFDEVLDEIAKEANDILGKLPNTANVTLEFRSESTTQKGTIKRAIVPIVSFGGIEAPFASGCSGGMSTSLELAVDLAISAVITRRTGSTPGWLALDEAFEGLDLVTKENCLEILKQFAEDKLVLVVDHMTETKEMFTQFIDIEFDNGVSSIL